jgi:hypothetical protein
MEPSSPLPLSDRADTLHRLLSAREGELVSSKDIQLAVGKGWRDVLKELQRRGVAVESAVGASGNWSFRVPAKPKPLDLTGWPVDLKAQMAGWNRPTKPSAVVIPFRVDAAAVRNEARSLGLAVFHGPVDRPVFVVEAAEPLEEHDLPRPRPDGLY